MALTLDDVRNKRFRMARKSGYEVLEVDEFVDEVEATFEQLFEENQNLKKQVESLKSTGRPAAEEASAATTSAPAATPTPVADSRPTERIVVTTGKEASTAVVRLVELSTEQAERLTAEAEAEAAQIREHANAAAAEVTSEAKARAEQLEAEARGRSDSLEREIEDRRTHLVGELEQQRDALTATVLALRNFEATYRANLTRHLQSQIEALESGSEEPADPPAALAAASQAGGATTTSGAAETPSSENAQASAGNSNDPGQGQGSSETPRLDALLGDQR